LLLNTPSDFSETEVHDYTLQEGHMNLVIVEDNQMVLVQLLRLIERQPAILLAGTAAEEDAAVSVILDVRPDAVLLDLSLAAGSGLNVLKRMRAVGNSARVLVLTNQTADIVRNACEMHGIDGFYDKSSEARACIEHLCSWAPPAAGGAS
jgi:diguanylate cyclase